MSFNSELFKLDTYLETNRDNNVVPRSFKEHHQIHRDKTVEEKLAG